MRTGRYTLPAALLGLAAAAAACAGPPTPAVGPAATAAVRGTRPPQPPPPQPLRAAEFPPVHESVLPNGLRLMVIENHHLPVADVALHVPVGTAADPPARAGLASLTTELLTKGTPARDARAIAEAIGRAGGELYASAGRDYTSLNAGVLSAQLPLAFELLSDVALRPTFPQDEVESARDRALSSLQLALSQPGALAQQRFLGEIYGAQHPYGSAELPQTVGAITRDDVRRFHAGHFRPAGALLVVSGDVTAAQAEALARRYFGDWQGAAPAAVVFPEPPAAGQSRITVIDRPGSVQSALLVGALAIRPDSPDRFALQVLNRIVGGGTDARLFQILREQKGWTYGAYSSISQPHDIGYYAARAEVRTEVTDSALVEMLHQLDRIRSERVPADELEAAKSYLSGSFPLTIQTTDQVAAQVARNAMLGLPLEALLDYRAKLAEVTADDVQRVARQYIRPDQATIIIVGDASRVLPMVRAIAPTRVVQVPGAAPSVSGSGATP